MEQLKLAVTHASSLLAEALLERMAKTGIKADSIVLLDQQQQAGNRLSFGGTYLTVLDQHEYDYDDLTAVLLLEPDAELENLLQHADCFVISHFVDGHNQEIFTPGVSVLPDQPCAVKLTSAELSNLLLVVNPIHSNYAVNSLNAVNILSSAFYGKTGVDELASQTISLLNSQDVKSNVFPLQLAFNMIPLESSALLEDQLTSAMQNHAMSCSVQNILVPAFHGLSIAVSLETAERMDLQEVTDLLSEQQGIKIEQQAISPLTDCKKGSFVIITGLHQPQKDINRLQFWIVADSVRNGLIQNYLNMLEILLKSYL